MRVLLTNDDGIYARGIRALCEKLQEHAEVFVVAPDRERSAVGHAITVHEPIRVDPSDHFGPKIRAWKVGGTPADCVKLGIEELIDPAPDVLVSGINRGPNLGTDILYSGTVSAAVEGMINGIPSVAVSLCGWDDLDYGPAAEFTARLVQKVHEYGLPEDVLLNVNVPAVPREEIAGVAVTRAGRRRYINVFEKRLDPKGRAYFWMLGDPVDLDEDPEYDTTAVAHNMISVSPVTFNLNHMEALEAIKTWRL